MNISGISTKINNIMIEKLRTLMTSDTVFIIGGGPSVGDILKDPTILQGKDIIVGNNAYKLYPNALLCHFMDKRWLQWHLEPKHNFLNVCKSIITTCQQGDLKNQIRDMKLPIYCFEKASVRGDGALCEKLNCLEGHNTGHQCINIAYQMGYKNVVLIGFDQRTDAPMNYHEDHQRTPNFEQFKKVMTPGFNRIADYIQKNSIDFNIVNANKNSALDCFKFSDINEWL